MASLAVGGGTTPGPSFSVPTTPTFVSTPGRSPCTPISNGTGERACDVVKAATSNPVVKAETSNPVIKAETSNPIVKVEASTPEAVAAGVMAAVAAVAAVVHIGTGSVVGKGCGAAFIGQEDSPQHHVPATVHAPSAAATKAAAASSRTSAFAATGGGNGSGSGGSGGGGGGGGKLELGGGGLGQGGQLPVHADGVSSPSGPSHWDKFARARLGDRPASIA
jgi:hypothetical protein